jgi:hypothetical protein
VPRTPQRVDVYRSFQAVCATSSGGQTSPSTGTLKARRGPLPSGTIRLCGGMIVGFRWNFFFFSLFSLIFLPKYKGVLSFIFCIQFDSHSFECYFFFSISSLIIWFNLIFISNLRTTFFLIF